MFKINVSKPLTLNETIDKAAEYFRNASTTGLGMCFDRNTSKCMYRHSEKEHTCVLGAFIPDELYNKEFDKQIILAQHILGSPKGSREANMPQWMVKLEQEYNIFTKLQNLHDSFMNWNDDGEFKAKAFAELEKLKIGS